MLTIFSTTKDFTSEFDIIQNNALRSWRALSQEIEIILIGDSVGTADMAKTIGAKHIRDVEIFKKGIPTVSGLFETAEKYSKNNILCYVNADIILPNNFLNIVSILLEQKGKFMAVGHRWDLDIDYMIQFEKAKESEKFWSYAKKRAKKHVCTGIDYFIFRKKTFNNLPPLAIGRLGWDNWLLWKARRMRIPLIDASNDLFVIHQNHGYTHMAFNNRKDVLNSKDVIFNRSIVNNQTLNLLDANWVMKDNEIVKNDSLEFYNRNLDSLQKIYPEFQFLFKLYKKINRRWRIL